MTIQMLPKAWYSRDFSVMADSRPVADIDISWWREKAVLTIEGKPYRVYRERLMSGAFILESAGDVLARAEKPSVFHRALLIHHEGREYTLRATSLFRRHFVLWHEGRQVGSLTPNNVLTRSTAVDLPADWPLSKRVFIAWLTVTLRDTEWV